MIEAVRIATGNAEHIQRTDRYLNEQNAATFDIGEKHLDYAVSKGDHAQQIQKTVGCRDRRREHSGEGGKPCVGKAFVDPAGGDPDQIMRKGVLQADAELV